MSALAHYLEREGIATVHISLVRIHSEKIRPPRGLWVPFELGRPLGAPADPAFQRRVLRDALLLLARTDGPILADFPDDAPDAGPVPGWRPPDLGGARDIATEMAALKPLYQRFTSGPARTTVGNSGLTLDRLEPYIRGYVDGRPPAATRDDIAGPQQMRFACDDLKAFYLEAALADGPGGSVEIADWFWGETAAGALLLTLRVALLASEQRYLQNFGRLMLVPGAQAWRARQYETGDGR